MLVSLRLVTVGRKNTGVFLLIVPRPSGRVPGDSSRSRAAEVVVGREQLRPERERHEANGDNERDDVQGVEATREACATTAKEAVLLVVRRLCVQCALRRRRRRRRVRMR